jgi:uncharacterized protein with von Willebrand factor type A (vWA) domain
MMLSAAATEALSGHSGTRHATSLQPILAILVKHLLLLCVRQYVIRFGRLFETFFSAGRLSIRSIEIDNFHAPCFYPDETSVPFCDTPS